ncbi:hypothetical protein ACTXPC_16775 [Brachybacterium alimentarium]
MIPVIPVIGGFVGSGSVSGIDVTSGMRGAAAVDGTRCRGFRAR